MHISPITVHSSYSLRTALWFTASISHLRTGGVSAELTLSTSLTNTTLRVASYAAGGAGCDEHC